MPPPAISCRRAAALAALAAGLAALAATGGCRRRGGADGSILDRIPAEADVAILVEPRALAGTWLDALAVALARRADVPDCVIARARAAGRVVVAWTHALPEDGWLVAMTGTSRRRPDAAADRAGTAAPTAGTAADRVAAPCPGLAVRGAVATWSRALDPRTDGDGFFDDRAVRNRWGALPARPVRGLAELELSAGIVVHTDLWLDPRDGVEAQATLRLDSPDAALGVRARLERWHADLEEDRMGGAWPLVAALDVAGPPPGDAALQLRVRLAGDAGAAAAPLFATALALGADRSDRAPCPLQTLTDRWHLTCRDGEFSVPGALRDNLVAHAADRFHDDFLTTTTSGGAVVGFRLVSLGAFSPLLALGFREGDGLRTLDGATITSLDQLAARARTALPGELVTVTFVRAGRTRTLRFRLLRR